MNVDRAISIISLMVSVIGLIWGFYTYTKDKEEGCKPVVSLSNKTTLNYYKYTYYKVSPSNTTSSTSGGEIIIAALIGILCYYIYKNYFEIIFVVLCFVGIICNILIYLLIVCNLNGYGLRVYHLIPTQFCYICMFVSIYFFVNPYFMPLEKVNNIFEADKAIPYVLLLLGAVMIIYVYFIPILEIVRDIYFRQKGYVKYKPYSWMYAILVSIFILALTSGLFLKLIESFQRYINNLVATL